MGYPIKYTFIYIEKCNMCGSDTKDHIVMGKRLNRSQGRNPKKKAGITTTIMKCTDCGLIYSNPMPIPNDIQDHYGLPPESYWVPEYFKISDNEFSNEISKLRTLMEIKPGSKSLDIGAGIGICMKALEHAGFDSYGVEPSEPFYTRAIEKMGINKDKIKLSSVENAEYPSDFFDFISFDVVLEHLYDPSAAIEKALSWLKPNGIIYIQVPSSKWLVSKIINSYYRLRGIEYVTNISPMHNPFHLYEFDLKSFEKNSKNKYEIAWYRYYVSFTYLPKIVDFFIKPYMKKTNTGMLLEVWLKKTE